MMKQLEKKIIVTLGPATHSEADLRRIKDKGVDFVRVNMSHSNLEDLRYFLDLAKKIGLEFVIDTEGSQVRTGKLVQGKIELEENQTVKIYQREILGEETGFNLKPDLIVEQLEKGDLIYIDFDAVILRVADISTLKDGYIITKVISAGSLGSNKAVVIHSGMGRKFILPALSAKDYQSIELGLAYGVNYLAVSFVRNRQAVEEARTAGRGRLKIISKIECVEALENLEQIIDASDFLLIDRGDLSKEVPLERIPFAQKIIIERARAKNVGVFVATNLLESMIVNKKPTRAEVHDIIQTIADGAYGLALSAETAIGKHPFASINMMKKIIRQAELLMEPKYRPVENWQTKKIIDLPKLADKNISSSLIEPHGGRLINRLLAKVPNQSYLEHLPKIILNAEQEMDAEQIAIGTFSPLEGFMGEKDFHSVLNDWRLASGVIWPLPIVLAVSQAQADELEIGQPLLLVDQTGREVAILNLAEKYHYDKKDTALKLYGTDNPLHPGVAILNNLGEVLLGGKIDLIKRRQTEFKEYELTPAQVRGLFEEKNWSKVVGFHTRNVIHRSHEFIQLKALNDEYCDGLFIHPIIGKKKPGDYQAKYIIASYEKMVKDFYPKNKAVFSVFSTFSRYAGPREAIFTALCRKNFGCSHFIVGRDHTGVGDFYPPLASHEVFDRFDDLGVTPVRFEKIFYSQKLNQHLHEKEAAGHDEADKLHISGTQARKIFESGQVPPEWFMRPEISEIISQAIKRGEEVFVRPEPKAGIVLWLTGLSGSGKSALALALKAELAAAGKKVEIIDGDTVRENLNKHLGFAREDIRENDRLIAELTKSKAKEVDFVLVPVIAPFQEDRQMLREIIGPAYHEVFLNCPLEKCIERDVKGLYKKALAGEIDNFIGVSQSTPYQAPLNSDLEIRTDQLSVAEAVELVINYLKNKSII
jgi:pyruvate kinase